MKMRPLILLLALLLGTSSLMGQYLRVAQEGRQWYSSYRGFFLGTEILSVGPDTNVLGQAYPTLRRQDQQGNFLETLGWIEEDTLAGTVVLHPVDSNQGDLHYDFSLGKGDTLSYPTLVGGRIVLTVDSVYQWTDFRNVTRRVQVMAVPAQNFCQATEVRFIEGIGPATSLRFPFDECSVSDIPAYTLRCVFDGGQRVYGDTTQQCYLVNEPEWTLSKAKAYPNPVQDYLYLETEAELRSYCLFGPSGKKVASGPWTGRRLHLAHLPAGLYLLQVRSAAGREMQLSFMKK